MASFGGKVETLASDSQCTADWYADSLSSSAAPRRLARLVQLQEIPIVVSSCPIGTGGHMICGFLPSSGLAYAAALDLVAVDSADVGDLGHGLLGAAAYVSGRRNVVD